MNPEDEFDPYYDDPDYWGFQDLPPEEQIVVDENRLMLGDDNFTPNWD